MLKKLFICIFFGLAIVSGCSNEERDVKEDANESIESKEESPSNGVDITKHEAFQPMKEEGITHIHGIGYPNSQSALFIATHHGLKVYSNGSWFETKQNNHDYMGFQATSTGFYSSGHPEEGSNLKNPLGLLFSNDYGQTLKQLSFYGESDFHFMALSYESNQVYVVNEHPNSEIGAGLFFSKDGKTWTQSKLSGLPAVSAQSIAVHPKLGQIIGLSTPKGLYLSHDNGDTFSLVTKDVPVFSFVFKENSILYVMEEKGALKLVEQSLESDDFTEKNLPKLVQDETVTSLAVSPLNEREISISTSKGSVWVTSDDGKNWTWIIEAGKMVNHH